MHKDPVSPFATPAPRRAIGRWYGSGAQPANDAAAFENVIARLVEPVFIVDDEGCPAVAIGGSATLGDANWATGDGWPLLAYAPPLSPEQLGDGRFRRDFGLRYAYIAGAMANGISSEELVIAMGRAGMIGFFGAAGLEPERIAAAIRRIQAELGDAPYGFNLIHSPHEPGLESAVVDLYLKNGVSVVSASAYLDLTLPLVRYRVAGLRALPDGTIETPKRVIAKVSRVEVARRFFSPPPVEMLSELVRRGEISEAQARLAERIPVAEDLTAEADSGGHTDNRPLVTLLPTMLALRDESQSRFGYARPLRVGAAGGISTPQSVAAAFALGAAYVLTGSVNQACREAGTCDAVRQMLADAEQADVTMAPAADMFEMGVKVQVLKRGTMFALRARKLYDLYRSYGSLDEIPPAARQMLERDYFRRSLADEWEQTKRFFAARDPAQLERAERDAKHKLALVFRSYLGQSSNWANAGEPSRKVDYQVWCGPAMGAFNEWTRGTFLADPEQRDVETVALNLLVGAAVATRAGWLRQQGIEVPADAEQYRPQTRDALRALLAEPVMESAA